MKKLMYISPNDKNSTNLLMTEQGLAYSPSHEGFICFDEVFNELNQKYNFDNEDDDGIYVDTMELGECLECNWEDECVVLHSGYGRDIQIEHCLNGDWEIALMPYTDDDIKCNPDFENNIKELFSSKDWYLYLLKEIKIIMLDLILDSIRMDVKDQIRNIEEEYQVMK